MGATENLPACSRANNSEPKRKYKSSQGYKVAIARTQNDPNNKFGGATMAASLWNPHIEGQQHSACRLKIHKGSNILQVGWRVDPTLYGDTKTRLFIHFQAGNIHCFNILCPGFVLVNTKILIDMVYDTISQIGENSWEDTMSINRSTGIGGSCLKRTINKLDFGLKGSSLI
nr:uncharacterized protein LOC117281672 [Nicotiana tomentosiformis]